MANKPLRLKSNIWNVSTLVIILLYIVFMIIPLFSLLRQAVIDKETGSFTLEYFITFFSKPYYSNTLLNSFRVTICVTILTTLIGTPLAYFFTRFEIKGKNVLRMLVILASMSAPFIGAYSWILLLGRNGLITNFASDIFGITLPTIYGFGGIVLVLTLQLYPLMFLYVSGALSNVDNSLLEASENLGTSGAKRFIKVIVPLILPTVLAGALLIFMNSLSDFGTPMLIGEGYRTFPVTIFNEFMSELGGDDGFAAAIASIAVVITTIVFLTQRYVANKRSFTMNSINKIRPIKPKKKITNILVHVYSYCIVGLSILPQSYLIFTSFRNTKGTVFVEGYGFDSYVQAFDKASRAITNTIIIPLISLVVIISIAVFIAYLVVRRKSKVTAVIDSISMIPYIIPGSVLGISLIIAFSKPPLILTGSLTIMVIALVIRRLPYTIRSTVATLQQIPLTVEEAGLSLGASNFKTFAKITIPMMAPGIISGAILSWITMITELSTAILLYTGKTRTMTIEIYTQVIRGNHGIAAALSAILTTLTVISLLIFYKVSKGKDIAI